MYKQLLSAAFWLVLMGAVAALANAAELVVTNTADANDGVCNADCSLREAVAAANASPTDDIITFDPTVFGIARTITLGGTQLQAVNNGTLTINGPGAGLLTISGNNQSRILFLAVGARVTLTGIRVTGGRSTDGGNGGGILTDTDAELTVNNAAFDGNVGPSGGGGGGAIGGIGRTTINNSAFNDNVAFGGGAVFIALQPLAITNCNFTANRSTQNAGGAVFVFNAPATIGGSIFKANIGAGDGGGVYATQSAITISNSVFQNNRGQDGGAIANSGNMTILGSLIEGNAAADAGGGIFTINGSMVITDTIINANRSSFGGGGGILSYSKMNITASAITNNTADPTSSGGGGIRYRASLSTLFLTNSVISGNVTSGIGGGLMNEGQGLNDEPAVDARGSLIAGNTAGLKGGGIYTEGGPFNPGRLDLTNTTVTNNRTQTTGGGLSTGNGYSLVNLLNVTISNNVAVQNGGGVESAGFTYTRNTIIGDNAALDGVSQDWTGFFDSLGYNLVENTTGVSFSGTMTGNVLGRDPGLGALKYSGGPVAWRALVKGSPAIDSADSANFPTFDQRGSARPIDGDGDGTARPDMGAVEIFTNEAARRMPFDFDGDAKTDISVYRPSDGVWHIFRSMQGYTSSRWGIATDKLVPADYDGDGKTDLAVFRKGENSTWYILASSTQTYTAIQWGATNIEQAIIYDTPVPADYDGDGKAEPAVWRLTDLISEPARFLILQSSNGQARVLQWGLSSDVPVPADFDGDERADLAIFRPASGQWWIYQSRSNGVFVTQFGASGDKAAAADYTGDGRADIAVWRPSSGVWYILRSGDLSFYAFPFGTNGDAPVPGDYDGDGKYDAGVFRPSDTTWYLSRSAVGVLIQQFGASSDLPVPNAYVR
ncbi:MAG: FG-GAP-like repeat-containing protein, partial [Pyrinomonadaceae bacterium]|nr:FG-GAP-like repeat-containing protein [Pyrinomonadaceae bacterium]